MLQKHLPSSNVLILDSISRRICRQIQPANKNYGTKIQIMSVQIMARNEARNDGTGSPEVIIFVCCNHLNVNYDDKKYCTTIQIMSVQIMAQNDGTGGGEVIILSAATI